MTAPHHAVAMEGIVLAAGSSARAGTFKPGLLLDGKPMIERCIEGMREVCERIIVVGGFSINNLRKLLHDIPGVECLENPAWSSGMFTSVKEGLRQARADQVFVLPVDTPMVPARVYRLLATADSAITVPTFHGRRGHPICLRASVLPELLCEPDGSSLRAFIHRTGFSTLEVDAKEVLLDIDTPEEYGRLIRTRAGNA
jgi:molybdenum cofactor cytidylyltransferase